MRFLLPLFCLGLLLVRAAPVSAQANPSPISFGLEQDILPYVLNGYFANVWAGKGHVRVRALLARVRKPDFMIPAEFSNNKVTALALVGDYFLRDDWSGFWLGAGLVNWRSSIQDNARTTTSHYDNWLLNGSLGYNFKIYRNFYVGPWAGLHLRMAGATEVTVGSYSYKLPLLNPEASVKVGWHFR